MVIVITYTLNTSGNSFDITICHASNSIRYLPVIFSDQFLVETGFPMAHLLSPNGGGRESYMKFFHLIFLIIYFFRNMQRENSKADS